MDSRAHKSIDRPLGNYFKRRPPPASLSTWAIVFALYSRVEIRGGLAICRPSIWIDIDSEAVVTFVLDEMRKGRINQYGKTVIEENASIDILDYRTSTKLVERKMEELLYRGGNFDI